MAREVYEVFVVWFVDDCELVDIFSTKAGAEARVRECVAEGADEDQYAIQAYQLCD